MVIAAWIVFSSVAVIQQMGRILRKGTVYKQIRTLIDMAGVTADCYFGPILYLCSNQDIVEFFY